MGQPLSSECSVTSPLQGPCTLSITHLPFGTRLITPNATEEQLGLSQVKASLSSLHGNQ